MTEKEKARAYDEMIEKLRDFYRDYDTVSCLIDVKEELANLFPELKENKMEWIEKIRQELKSYLEHREVKQISESDAIHQWIIWLEKQDKHIENNEDDSDADFTIYYPSKNGEGRYECIPYSFYGMLSSFSEDKDMIDFLHLCFYTEEECNEWIKQNESVDTHEHKFNVGDWVVTDKGDTIQITAVNPGYYTIDNGMEFNMSYFDKYWHLWTIQDAKDGDILDEGSCIFIFKKLNDDMSADTYCVLFDDGDYANNCHLSFDYKTTYPATHEKSEELFVRMKSEGYEWDADKKQLNDIKIKPKFCKGDWVICTDQGGYEHIRQITKIETFIPSYDSKQCHRYWTSDLTWFGDSYNARLWTIDDAKDGDVLYDGNNACLFRNKMKDDGDIWVDTYCGIDSDGMFTVNGEDECWCLGCDCVPATKEQRDILFKKMKKAGWKWDNINKLTNLYSESEMTETLRTEYEKGRADAIAEMKSYLDEEDIRIIQNIDSVLFYDKDLPEDRCMQLRDWLKSLKQRFIWKPNKVQMIALSEASGIVGMLTPRGTHLQSLYNDLKMLTND